MVKRGLDFFYYYEIVRDPSEIRLTGQGNFFALGSSNFKIKMFFLQKNGPINIECHIYEIIN